MHSIGLQMCYRMKWKGNNFGCFREIRGGIARVIINKPFINIILVIISAFNWITNILMHGIIKEMY